jgi:DNA-binding MarR family transcriptional regulator
MNLETFLWKVQEPTRLRILTLIAKGNGATYGRQLARRLHMCPNTVEHHVKLLQKWGLIEGYNRVNMIVRNGKPIPLPRTFWKTTPKAQRLLIAIRKMRQTQAL